MIIIKKKKLLTGLLIGSLALLCFASGAIASSHLTKITAYLNSAISVELKGKPLNLSQSQPITYNNTTYLPLRTIAEATGLDVKWNSENQLISLYEKMSSTPGERKTFSKNIVTYNSSSSTAEFLLNPKEIPFSNKQYKEMIMVGEINSSGKGFYLTFPKETTKVGVTLGSKVKGTNTILSYKIYDDDYNVLALGDLNSNSVTFEEFELSDAGTRIKIEFTGELSGHDVAYLVYDESWYE